MMIILLLAILFGIAMLLAIPVIAGMVTELKKKEGL